MVCLHVHLAPVARMVATPPGRLTIFLLGIEAWKPLSWLQRRALAAAGHIVAISEHTARRFRESNPALAARWIHVCHPAMREEAKARQGSMQ